jgi:hypothetical protein
VNGVIVALGSSPRGSLPAPFQVLPKKGPHVRRVIRHASQPRDHLCYTLQGPHIIRIAVGFRTFEQLTFDMRELVSAQLWQPAGTTCATQPGSPRPTPRGAPVGDDLMRDTNLPCTIGRDHALLEQIRGLHTPRLERREVASWPNPPIHRPAPPLLYRNKNHP